MSRAEDETEPTVDDFVKKITGSRANRVRIRGGVSADDVFAELLNAREEPAAEPQNAATDDVVTLDDDEAATLGRRRQPGEHGAATKAAGRQQHSQAEHDDWLERSERGNDKLREQNTGRHRG
jgi:hypothetical protein